MKSVCHVENLVSRTQCSEAQRKRRIHRTNMSSVTSTQALHVQIMKRYIEMKNLLLAWLSTEMVQSSKFDTQIWGVTHVHSHTHIHTHAHTYTHTRTRTHTHTHTHTRVGKSTFPVSAAAHFAKTTHTHTHTTTHAHTTAGGTCRGRTHTRHAEWWPLAHTHTRTHARTWRR